MKLRRMATTVAATSALVLAAAPAALADHAVPELEEGNIECSDLGLEPLGDKVDPPVDVDNEFYTATLSDNDEGEPALLDVVAKDGVVIGAVLVKGTPDANVFSGPDFTHLFAPEAGGSGEPAEISHFSVCAGEVDEEEENGEEEEEDGMGGGEPTETPAAVPTEIPAGVGTAGAGAAGTAGLVAMIAAFVAGAALIVRRRFLTES